MAVMPIIPVGRVLLPGATMTVNLPPGYEGTLADSRVGGAVVALRRSGEESDTHPIGTVADIIGRRTTIDGVLMVQLRGRARAVVSGYVDGADGDDPLGDPAGARVARRAAVKALRGYLAALAERGTVVDILVDVPADPVEASYRVASLLELSAPEMQHVLAAPTAEERLVLLAGVVMRETALLRSTF